MTTSLIQRSTQIRSDLFSDEKPKIYAVGLPITVIRPGTITVIGAPPGEGKTSLTMQLIFDALRLDESLKVVVANVEMTSLQLIQRELARMSGVSLSTIRDKSWDEEQKQEVSNAYDKLTTLFSRLEYVVPPFDLKVVAQKMQEHEPQIVVLDYIQLIKCDKENPKSDKKQEIDEVLSTIRAMAMQWEVAFIVVSSMNRGKNGYDSEITMDRFADSQGIEYCVDNAFGLEERIDTKTKTQSVGERQYVLKHIKARDDEPKDIELRFVGKYQSWGEK